MKQSLKIFLLFVVTALVLSACSSLLYSDQLAQAVEDETKVESSAPVNERADEITSGTTRWADGQPRLDEQGAVTVEVTSVNLNSPGETLDFEVALNTHSVDLSMDLGTLATLTTDTGKIVSASGWDAPAGGHHVSGVLSFPTTLDGAPLLEGSYKLTLTLVDVDAPQRLFEWYR